MGDERYDEEFQRAREEKLLAYSLRAQAGLPLFEPAEAELIRELAEKLPHLPHR